jgi:hypothetical protein
MMAKKMAVRPTQERDVKATQMNTLCARVREKTPTDERDDKATQTKNAVIHAVYAGLKRKKKSQCDHTRDQLLSGRG